MRSKSILELTSCVCVLLATGGLLLACGGGGSRSSTMSPAPVCVSFAAVSGPAQGSVATQEAAASTCEVLAVDLMATNVTDLFTASFTATFDSSIVTYEGYDTGGSVLGSDGAQLQVLEQTQPGEVSLGITRTGVTDGIDVGAPAALVRVYFRKTSADSGTTDLSYTSGSLLGSETPPLPKPGIQWVGGTMTLQ
ncbi:MAG: hypothetical protein R3344_04555 [Acidobacteriota bacterium]|nr:hypothetical protein [Acidobacteriota bacterium]